MAIEYINDLQLLAQHNYDQGYADAIHAMKSAQLIKRDQENSKIIATPTVNGFDSKLTQANDDLIRHYQWKQICSGGGGGIPVEPLELSASGSKSPEDSTVDGEIVLPRKASSSSTIEPDKNDNVSNPSNNGNVANSRSYKKLMKDRFLTDTKHSREQCANSPAMSESSSKSSGSSSSTTTINFNVTEITFAERNQKRKCSEEDAYELVDQSRKCPGFVLHPSKKFYMPTFFDVKLSEELAQQYQVDPVVSYNNRLHPVSIFVSFTNSDANKSLD